MKLAYTIEAAAEVMDVSIPFFRDQVLPEIPVVRRGRRVMVPRRSLEDWLDGHAETP